jgi:subtilisin family serine protease
MKSYFTIFIILAALAPLKAQSVFNTALLRKMYDSPPTETVPVLVLAKPGATPDFRAFPTTKLYYKVGNIYSITASLQDINNIAKLSAVIRMEYVQHDLKLMADTCVVRNRIRDIKLGLSPLTQAYDGTGVTVGVIDSGTDFNHPDFKDSNGNSRIKFLWDMNKPVAANTPTPFGYGQEWTNADIDMGLCTHDDLAHYGHGSNSSGIAAGNGLSIGHFEGMAPKADIIVVALDFGRPGFTIADALQYIITKAQLLGQPLVVNASVGDYYGSHDGTDLEAQMISGMIASVPGRAMVAACGNGGGNAFHVGYNTTAVDTFFTWISSGSSNIYLDEYSDTTQVKNVFYSVGVNNGGLTNLGNIPFKPYNYALNTLKRDTIYNNSNRIGIVESMASINSFGVYELSLKISADSSNYLWRIEHTGPGRIDSWNFNYISGTMPTPAEYPNIVNYKMADTVQTIVSGFHCSNEIISVANYVNRKIYQDVNNNTQVTAETAGQISQTSSLGPTRDNRIKPDIAASGATILTTGAIAMLPNLIANAPQVVALGGYHVTAGGTSASSPVVAGLAALYLQKHPTATNQQVKQAIINCAYSDVFTGTSLPNNQWGYGKLDGFAAMTCGEVVTGLKDQKYHAGINVIPNPVNGEATVFFEKEETRIIRLYNSTGQLVLKDDCSANTYKLMRNNLPSGLYFIECESKNEVKRLKILIL